MWLGIIVFAIAIGIGVMVGVKQGNITKQLIADGRMIPRDVHFVETAEIFTLQNADFSKVLDGVMQMRPDLDGTGAAVKYSEEAKLVVFSSSHGWEAALSAEANEGEAYTYRFNFTKWDTRNGVAQNMTSMNVALTALEKMFIRLDPNTKVSAERIKTKSKSRLF